MTSYRIRTPTWCQPAAERPSVGQRGLSSVDAITWSPASRRLAVTGSHDDEVGAGWQGWIFVLEPAKAPLRLTDDSIKPAAGYAPIIPPPEIAWTEDGRIVLLADRHGESYLYEVDVNGGTPQQVEGGGSQLSGATFDAKARYAVAVVRSADVLRTPAFDRYPAGLASGSDRLQRGVFRRPPARSARKVHHLACRREDRVTAILSSRLRVHRAVPSDSRHSRRAPRGLLRCLQSSPAGAGHSRLHRAGGEPAGIVHVWQGLPKGCDA